MKFMNMAITILFWLLIDRMKIKKGDIIKTKEGTGIALYTENFRTCDRVILNNKTLPEKFEFFNDGVAFFTMK